MPAFATGLREKFRKLAAYARDARMLMSGSRNPWRGGKPTLAYKTCRFLFCVSVLGFVSCFMTAFKGSQVIGVVFMAFNAVNMWMNFRDMMVEKFKAYIEKVLDSSGRGEDPYEKAAIKFAVAWPLLDLDRKFYEDFQRATADLPIDLRTPDSVYTELVYIGCGKRGRI